MCALMTGPTAAHKNTLHYPVTVFGLQGSGVPRNFVWGGVQQIQFRTENGDLGAVAVAVEPGYNDVGLCETSFIASDILWHQLIPRC